MTRHAAGLSASSGPPRVPSPEIVYGSYEDSGAGIVVLMDLNDSGFQTATSASHGGYGLRQLLAVCEALAEFHAVGTAFIAREFGGDEDRLAKRFPKLFLKQKKSDNETAAADVYSPFFKDYAKFLRRVPGRLQLGYKRVNFLQGRANSRLG